MEFFRVAIVFLFGGVAGFFLEFFFRRFVSFKKWVKPGFLVGPFIPLYAFGLSLLYAFTRYAPFANLGLPEVVANLLQTLLLGILITILEGITGLFFLQVFHLRLWDYTGSWGNFKGVICPLFSAIWTLLAAAYVFLLHGPISLLVDKILFYDASTGDYGSALSAILFILGILYGVLLIDVFYSFSIVSRLRKLGEKAIINYDRAKTQFGDAKRTAKELFPFFFPFAHHLKSFDATWAEVKELVASESENRRVKMKASQEEKKQLKAMKEEERKNGKRRK